MVVFLLNFDVEMTSLDKIATLGPSGTSSDYVARKYLESFHLIENKIILFDSFEKAAEAVLNEQAKFLLVPHAYKNINYFYMNPMLKLEKIFTYDTPMYGIATRIDNSDFLYSELVSHEAPIPMVDYYLSADINIELANSTSAAAELVSRGTFDFCITNEEACKKYKLKFIESFHAINMSWSIFIKRKEI